ncbi:MAG: hypothetical protein ACLVCW_03945 [Campylobacter sp.]
MRQEASTAKKQILCRIYLRALKARRDLDADGVTRSLQGAKYTRRSRREPTMMDVIQVAVAARGYGL